MKAGLDYFKSRKYAYFLTFFNANNADSEIMLRPKFTFSMRRSLCYRLFLSAFAGIYYPFWLTGCEFIHKSLLEKYTGSYCYNKYVSACLFLYISKSLLLFCSYLKIYTFKCAAFNYKHVRGRAVKCRNCPMFCNGSWVQSSATSTFFFPFFSLVSLKMLVYILLQALRFI